MAREQRQQVGLLRRPDTRLTVFSQVVRRVRLPELNKQQLARSVRHERRHSMKVQPEVQQALRIAATATAVPHDARGHA